MTPSTHKIYGPSYTGLISSREKGRIGGETTVRVDKLRPIELHLVDNIRYDFVSKLFLLLNLTWLLRKCRHDKLE